MAVQPQSTPTATPSRATPGFGHKDEAPRPAQSRFPHQPSWSYLFHFLLRLWFLLCLLLQCWLLLFLRTFCSPGPLWQLWAPLPPVPPSEIIQSLGPDPAAILGKDELRLGYKTWAGRGQKGLLVLTTCFGVGGTWSYLCTNLCTPGPCWS